MSYPVAVQRPAVLADVVSGRSFVRSALLVAGGALLTALLAQVSIPLPFTPVPITLQTFGVLVTGAALGSRKGALSMVLYALLGLLGLPVLAGGSGGVAFFTGPTGGYLIGFILSGYVVGRLAERGWDRDRKAILAMIAGEIALYAVALPWLGFNVGFGKVLALGFLPFVAGDALKLLAAAGLLPLTWKGLSRTGA